MYAVLMRYHREVAQPGLDALAAELRTEFRTEIGSLRNETLSHFDALYQRLSRIETEYHALSAGLKRLEAGHESLSEAVGRLENGHESLSAAVARLEDRLPN